jgi:large subunit ribosomal protein L15
VKKSRKFFGTRRWGAGNIKNARGAGDRGGVGRGGRKHKMSYYWVYDRESTHHEKGFAPFKSRRLGEMDLDEVSRRARASKEQKPVLELKGYKVLGDGRIERPVVVRASGFTKSAEKKIAAAGGEAVKV